MFPVVECTVSGLGPDDDYEVVMDNNSSSGRQTLQVSGSRMGRPRNSRKNGKRQGEKLRPPSYTF